MYSFSIIVVLFFSTMIGLTLNAMGGN
jgi:hypothetical protein